MAIHRPRPHPEVPGPGQESVWDYPRPPVADPTDAHVVVRAGGRVLADTRRAVRVLETSHPPTYYLPPDDVDRSLIADAGPGSVCEWKGQASYGHVVVGDLRRDRAVWWYPDPTEAFATIAEHISCYPALLDCTVDGVAVRPQAGGFYGGWVTDDVVGPFKGEPGTLGW